MYKALIFISLIFLLVSCYHENKAEPVAPDPLLSEEQIVELLSDIQTAEAVIAYNRLHRENTDQQFKDSLFKKIFDHYNLSAEEVNDLRKGTLKPEQETK